jgi:uncharacterized protein (DUF4415 family)
MKKQYDFSKGKRGPVVPAGPNKIRITIRIDADILDWFREQVRGGGNYQTLINDALREHIQRKKQSLEDVLRKVVREEMERVGQR